MTKVFISGSIKIKNIDSNIIKRLDNIIESKYSILVGDASGIDSSIQKYLKEKAVHNVTVYCTGNRARNNFGNWSTHNVLSSHRKGTREYFTAKDVEMAKACDYGFMIWDTQSAGTLSNTIELLKLNKKSLVYINKEKIFMTVKDPSNFISLISTMSETAIQAIEKKIKLSKTVELLNNQQTELFNVA